MIELSRSNLHRYLSRGEENERTRAGWVRQHESVNLTGSFDASSGVEYAPFLSGAALTQENDDNIIMKDMSFLMASFL